MEEFEYTEEEILALIASLQKELKLLEENIRRLSEE